MTTQMNITQNIASSWLAAGLGRADAVKPTEKAASDLSRKERLEAIRAQKAPKYGNKFAWTNRAANEKLAETRPELSAEQLAGLELPTFCKELPADAPMGSVREALGLSGKDFVDQDYMDQAYEVGLDPLLELAQESATEADGFIMYKAADLELAELNNRDLDTTGAECLRLKAEGDGFTVYDTFTAMPDELPLRMQDGKDKGGHDRKDSMRIDADWVRNSTEIDSIQKRIAYQLGSLKRFPKEAEQINRTVDYLRGKMLQLQVSSYGEGYPSELDTSSQPKPQVVEVTKVLKSDFVIPAFADKREPHVRPQVFHAIDSAYKFRHFQEYVQATLNGSVVTPLLVLQLATELYRQRPERAVMKLGEHLFSQVLMPKQPALNVSKDTWDGWVQSCQKLRSKQFDRAARMLQV